MGCPFAKTALSLTVVLAEAAMCQGLCELVDARGNDNRAVVIPNPVAL